jgi:hypothetical protein
MLGDLLWYAILWAGVWRSYTLLRAARALPYPIEAARQAATAFGVAGILLWFFALRDEVRSGFVFTNPSVMGFLGLIGTALIYGVLILLPMWTPRLLLNTQQPSSLRRMLIVVIARFVAVFAGACILIAPLMFSFANSLGEFLGAVFGVAIPLVVLILISNTLVKLVRRLPG